MDRLKQLKANIIFLQETNLLNDDTNWVSKRWPGQFFFLSPTPFMLWVVWYSVPFQLH